MLGEKHLAISSLACAAFGITMLFLLNEAIEPRELSVREINESLVGERVSVAGRVDWALEKDNFILFTLNDGAKIKAIKFSPSWEERGLAGKGSYVTVVGKVQLYKNEIEIVAEEIRQW